MERTEISMRSCTDRPSVDETNENVKHPVQNAERMRNAPSKTWKAAAVPTTAPVRGGDQPLTDRRNAGLCRRTAERSRDTGTGQHDLRTPTEKRSEKLPARPPIRHSRPFQPVLASEMSLEAIIVCVAGFVAAPVGSMSGGGGTIQLAALPAVGLPANNARRHTSSQISDTTQRPCPTTGKPDTSTTARHCPPS